MFSERGQATIEWVGLVLLIALGLTAIVAAIPIVDGRSFGGFLSHRLVCAVRGSACAEVAEQLALKQAYGAGDADLVQRFAPGLVYEPGEREVPVDFRECRRPSCARTPDDRDLDVHRTDAGRRVTVFTRVVRRGGFTYIQYWFYYPDSNSTVLGADKLWKALPPTTVGGRTLVKPRYPGFHLDDWEGYEVRVDRRGHAAVRSTSHGGLQYCKWTACHGQFGPNTGWTRVSRGSHSGHVPVNRRLVARRGARRADGSPGQLIPGVLRRVYLPQVPGVNLRERTSTADGQRLVPLETLDKRGYHRLSKEVSPPWEKRLYRHPAGGGS